MAQIGTDPTPAVERLAGHSAAVLNDEQALRRAYDQHADALVAAATARLGESAYLATRVAEQAFVQAWHARERITSDAALAAFLADEVERGSARALSRQMAAHRLGHHGSEALPDAKAHARPSGAYDREVSWSHVLQGARADAMSAKAHERAAAIAHHDAAVHIAEATRQGSWVRPLVLGAVTVAAAIGVVWLIDSLGADRRVQAAVTSGPGRTVEAGPGQLAALELADGSAVRLAPGTQLFIPERFGADLRAVRVTGAARVNVAPGQDEPLRVVVGPATLIATGTAFSVRAYPADGGATVLLHEGSASLRAGDSAHTLTPGRAMFVPDSGVARAATTEQVTEVTAWTENAYVAHDRRLGDVLEDFQRWYRTQIFIADPALAERRVTVRASLDSVRQAIAGVERSANVKFGYVSGKMVFTARK